MAELDIPEEQLDEYITNTVKILSKMLPERQSSRQSSREPVGPVDVDLWCALVRRFIEDPLSIRMGICHYDFKDYLQLCSLLGEFAATHYKTDPAYLICTRYTISKSGRYGTENESIHDHRLDEGLELFLRPMFKLKLLSDVMILEDLINILNIEDDFTIIPVDMKHWIFGTVNEWFDIVLVNVFYLYCEVYKRVVKTIKPLPLPKLDVSTLDKTQPPVNTIPVYCRNDNSKLFLRQLATVLHNFPEIVDGYETLYKLDLNVDKSLIYRV
jgi:hypothetical protein